MRTTKDVTEAQRISILQTAYELFAEKGYAATNIKDIADAAGISRTPIYYHFRDKANLFMCVYLYWTQRIYQDYCTIYTSNESIFEIFRKDYEYSLREVGKKAYLIERDLILYKDEAPEAYLESKIFTQKLTELEIRAVQRAIDRGELKKDTDARIVVGMHFVFYYGLEHALSLSYDMWSEEEYQKMIDESIEAIKRKYKA